MSGNAEKTEMMLRPWFLPMVVVLPMVILLIGILVWVPSSEQKLEVHTDPDTGCQYLQPGDGRNNEHLTPRMAPDGTQVCVPVGKP